MTADERHALRHAVSQARREQLRRENAVAAADRRQKWTPPRMKPCADGCGRLTHYRSDRPNGRCRDCYIASKRGTKVAA